MDIFVGLAPFVQVGAGGLLTIGILLILTGRLVPSGTVDKLLAGRDERIKELREVVASEQERNCRQADQITSLLESGRTTAHAFEEIRKVAADHGAGGVS
ncbi:hypothetical protein [Nocardiopsis alba]|uniref:Uncharacterized protein n=1 Tax=Nocardiopsis alba TaxID=53437 RepID=A0A7K2IL80_9ACTN|nr:hypothetical protein [Nocardiopsis alba]MYR30728.1 hypothetical protein [Nocardiopsis alba]